MTYNHREQDRQFQQSYRLGMQGGWTQGAKWTRRLLWILGIAWVVAVIAIYAGARFYNAFPRFIISLYLNPSAVLPWLGLKSGGPFQPWQILTSSWIPSASLCGLVGLMHLMYLLVFAPRLEREWGSAKFLRFYLTVAYVSTILALLLRGASPFLQMTPASTASAAIFGLMVAYALTWPRDPLYVFGLFPFQVIYVVLAMCALEVIFSIVSGSGGFVDYIADVVGIVLVWTTFKVPIIRAFVMGGSTKARATPSTNECKDRTKFLEM
jgi:membrane associated rhomboid family serine protease